MDITGLLIAALFPIRSKLNHRNLFSPSLSRYFLVNPNPPRKTYFYHDTSEIQVTRVHLRFGRRERESGEIFKDRLIKSVENGENVGIVIGNWGEMVYNSDRSARVKDNFIRLYAKARMLDRFLSPGRANFALIVCLFSAR